MREWRECKLGDAPVSIIDGDRGKNYPKNWHFSDDGYCLFLNTKNVTKNGFDFSELNFIDKNRDDLLSKGKLQRNDVVLTTRGTIGNVAYYDDTIAFENVRINSGMVIVRPDGIDPDYNHCLFRYLKSFFSVFVSGSAQPQLPIKDLKQIPVKLPPLPEQKAIAEVLGSLDDKIDLLHRQNKTLESLAETLFRQWFVEEADEEWEDCLVEDLCSEIASGGTPSTKNSLYYNGNINWYSTKELQDNFLFESDSKITDIGLNNSSAKLFAARTILIAIYASPTVGRLGILASEAAFNQAACGLIAKENIGMEWLYLFLKDQRQEFNSLASGSAQQNLNVQKIKKYPAFLADAATLIKFKEYATPIFDKIKYNTQQIQTLENLRDLLLPKLMSGEIRLNGENAGLRSLAPLIVAVHP